jgi:peptide/nickel transport system substrate-binding protein
MLTEAGLPTTVMPLDLGVLLARLDAGDFQLAILQIPELTEPNVLSWFFHPRGVPGEGGLGRNRARYRSAEAASLLDRASTSSSRSERREAYRAFADLVLRDVPVAPLWHEDQIAVVSERARAFQPSAEGRWLALARLE